MQENEVNFNRKFESEFNRTSSMYEQKTTTITREYESYKSDATRRIAEYENRIALLSQELERENGNLRAKSEEARQLELQLRNATAEI